ncbi:hypothetical protein SNL152K_6113 [Streptomyces sp. NL15-2K]|nr:hypothetical protein SNL152K_6113 [Streptomyces sp. NL15-2K]
MRVHGCPNTSVGATGRLPPTRRSGLGHTVHDLRSDLVAGCTGSLTLSALFGVKRRR